MKQTFLIIDANSLIHRAYHALPPLTDSEGKPAGALYGLSSIMLKILREISPEYAVAAFDRPEPTFREKEYSAYKEHRPEAEENLVSQLISSKEFFKAFGLISLDYPGFEADDIIGTVAYRASSENIADKIVILSGDLDILQLVEDDRVIAWIPQKGISSFTEYNREAVINRFGVPPEHIPDFKGLVGDTSDNIPGVSGIGPKTAAELIKKYGPLEDLYALSPEPKTAALKNVIDNKEIALLSKNLATIAKNVPISFPSVSDFKVNPLPQNELSAFLLAKGFRNLSERVNRSNL
ncbi:MAG: 5'-3' exonuclease H3TH domain-containing protein [Parcubacteria group bacterium]